MNLMHRRICRSDKWATKVRDVIIPGALRGIDVGSDVLELGPGPGRTTEVLLTVAPRLTAIELDAAAAAALRKRLDDPRLTVVEGDAAAMPFPDESFTAVVSLTMLHHVPSVAAQDRLFAEVARVLRPGGVFTGSDGLLTPHFRLIHLFDTLVAVDPATLPGRLRAVELEDVSVTTDGGRLWFRARRPLAFSRRS